MKKLLFILLGLTSLNVDANGCGGEYQPATGTCRIIDSSGRQILYNVPQSKATQPQKRIEYVDVHVPSKFGAIAISKKAGHITGSLNHKSLSEAKSEAIKRCEKDSRGAPCEVLKWVRNGCIAAAAGNLKGTSIIIGGAAEQGVSEQTAIANCTNAGAKECRIVMPEGCSLP